jgi:hypothetical protein
MPKQKALDAFLEKANMPQENTATGDPTNAERRARAKSMLEWYNTTALGQPGEADEDTLRDVLADLMHLSDTNVDFPFEESLDIARRNYMAEVTEEKAQK